MKVLFLLRYSDDQASSRVRGRYVANALGTLGVSTHVVCGYGRSSLVPILISLWRFDVVIFQKRYTGLDIMLARLARALGKTVLFDLDDAPGGRVYSSAAERQAIGMMRVASAVVVGCENLVTLGKKHNSRVFYLPTSILLEHYPLRANSSNPSCHVLGWMGNGTSYRDDLSIVCEPLRLLAARFPIKLRIVGALGESKIYQDFQHLPGVQVDIVDSIEWRDHRCVARELSTFDIGLYPLLDTPYNRYKCGFKALEYFATGIPVVASPVGENSRVIEDGGDGFLVEGTQQWVEKLSVLLENRQLRQQFGQRGREKVENKYVMDRAATTLFSHLQSLMKGA